jgi:sulfur relay protein TusB/DsrH
MVDKNKIMFLVGYKFRRTDIWENLFEILNSHINLGADISLVFIQDGVIGLNKRAIIPVKFQKVFTLPINFYALLPDVLSRGINSNLIKDTIKLIDYNDLVDLLIENPKVVSWL